MEQTMQKERLFYIDNLRLLMIVFVVMHHLAVTYSGLGSWYYNENTLLDPLSRIWFSFYLSFEQAYFMGLLFMLAGYFAAGSYDRKGFGRSTGDRFQRLIIPSLIYMIIITPFIGMAELGGGKPSGFSIADFLSGTGVMWFAVALFIFSLIYGFLRLIVRNPENRANKELDPSFPNIVFLILIIAVSAFLIRIVQPIGTNILNMQLCYFASYIVLFIVGILAYRNNLFTKISYKTGKKWLVCGISLGLIIWLLIAILAIRTGDVDSLGGGITWQSAFYSVWESFVAVSMSIGLVAVFREKFNRQNKLIKILSDNSFIVYMFHPPIIVGITLLLKPLALPPIVKWLLLCIICVPLCFAAAHFVFRRIPLLRKVF